MKATVFNKSWLYDDTGMLYGIEVGYDLCGDHQGGIQNIRDAFGIRVDAKDPVVGINARLIKMMPHVEEYSFGDFLGFGYSDMPDGWLKVAFDDAVQMLSWSGRTPGEDDFLCYWGENGFFLVSKNDNIRVLHAAFNKLDVALLSKHGTSGQMSIWATPVVVIASRTPEEMRDRLVRADNETLEKNSTEPQEKPIP